MRALALHITTIKIPTKLAALAGVGRTTVQNAVREATALKVLALGTLASGERRISAWPPTRCGSSV